MFTVSDKARDYISIKGGCIYISHGSSAAMCCGRVHFGPSVILGKPAQTNSYIIKEINEVNVYLPDNFLTPFPLIIDLGDFLWRKYLRIDGWKLF